MSHATTCPSGLTGRIRGMKVREEALCFANRRYRPRSAASAAGLGCSWPTGSSPRAAGRSRLRCGVAVSFGDDEEFDGPLHDCLLGEKMEARRPDARRRRQSPQPWLVSVCSKRLASGEAKAIDLV